MSKDPAVNKVVEKLQRAQARRESKYNHFRDVYAYRVNGSDVICDNLLLMPTAHRAAHSDVLTRLIRELPREQVERMRTVNIVRVGTFDVRTLRFTHVPEKRILSIADLLKDEV